MKPREKRFLREVDRAIQKALNGNSQGLIKQSILWREEGFSENTWRKYVRILVNMGRYAIDSSPRGTIFTFYAAIIIH
jgi:DNA-binding Lrp family transcriptional regulator